MIPLMLPIPDHRLNHIMAATDAEASANNPADRVASSRGNGGTRALTDLGFQYG